MTSLAILIVFAVIFLPDIQLTSSFAARPEDPLILVAFVYLVYTKTIFNTFFTKLLLVMFVIMFISIGVNDRLLSLNSFEFYNKIVKGLVAYTMCLEYMQEEQNYQRMVKFLTVSIAILIVLNFIQVLQLPGFNKFFGVYSNATQMDSFERRAATSIPRATGLVGNPNTDSTLFLFLGGFLLDQFFYSRQRIYTWLLVGSIFVIMLTQSRTMFMTTGILMAMTVVASGNLFILIFGIGVVYLIKFLDIPYLALIFDTDKLSQTNSVVGRLREWGNLVNMIKLQPIIGYGGYKEYFYITQTYPENEYILAWFRYGITYLILYIYSFIHLLIKGLINILRHLPGGYFLFSSNLGMLVGSVSNTPFNHPRLFVLYAFANAFFEASLLFQSCAQVKGNSDATS